MMNKIELMKNLLDWIEINSKILGIFFTGKIILSFEIVI